MKVDTKTHLKMSKVDSRRPKIARNSLYQRSLNLTFLSRGWSLKLMQTTFSIICRCSSVYNKSFFTHPPQHQIWRVPVLKISPVIITWKIIQTKTMETTWIQIIKGTFRWIKQCVVRWRGSNGKTMSKSTRASRSWWNRGTWSHPSTIPHLSAMGATQSQPIRSLNTLEGWTATILIRSSRKPSGSSWPHRSLSSNTSHLSRWSWWVKLRWKPREPRWMRRRLTPAFPLNRSRRRSDMLIRRAWLGMACSSLAALSLAARAATCSRFTAVSLTSTRTLPRTYSSGKRSRLTYRGPATRTPA